MAISAYVTQLRECIGHATLLLPAAAAIIHDEAGQVLLIRRGDGRGWSLPGGALEPGERLAEAVTREVREETGLEVEPLRIVGIYSDPDFLHITYPHGDQVHYVSTTFECRVVGGSLQADGEESLEVAYFAPDNLPDDLVCDHARRIGDALAGHQAAIWR